jgi:gluconolactonase
MADALTSILETTVPEQVAAGFQFTEGPTWHPEGYLYFVDLHASRLLRVTPGESPMVVREHTGETNGTTFDLQGRLLLCESGNRRIARMDADGRVEPVVERFEGKRFNRPNDIICRSDGSIYFTDPGLRVPLEDRELPYAGVYRVTPDGAISLIADCEYPNGLAFSLDERTLYVANTRHTMYIHALELTPDGSLAGRRIFADMSSDDSAGVPDGMKVDQLGRIFCTGPGGTWVFDPDGTKLGVIPMPEIAANVAFGGPDLQTLFFTARGSVYSLRVKVPGQPHPWYARQARPK